jgi:hypothetical protein
MKFVAVGIGFIAGIFFVVACQNVQMPNAHAAPADCAVWQYAQVNDSLRTQFLVNSATAGFELPAGWEPFAVDSADVYVRRCKP